MENQMNRTKGATATGNFWLLVMVAAGLFANPQMQDVFAQCGGREAGCCGEDSLENIFHSNSFWASALMGCSDEETTMGNRLWVGPRWERRSGNDAAFPVEGSINGVSVGWRSRNADAVFLSVEGVFNDGEFKPTTGGRTDYEEWQIEALVGYTFSNECRSLFVTPYTGIRYREAENVLGAPLNLNVDQDVWTAPFGVRTDFLLTDTIAIGLDARLQWKIEDEQLVTAAAFTIPDEAEHDLTYRLDAPVTFRVCSRGEIEVRPYYEWDRFDSDAGNRKTRIDEYGGQVSFILRY